MWKTAHDLQTTDHQLEGSCVTGSFSQSFFWKTQLPERIIIANVYINNNTCKPAPSHYPENLEITHNVGQ